LKLACFIGQELQTAMFLQL